MGREEVRNTLLNTESSMEKKVIIRKEEQKD